MRYTFKKKLVELAKLGVKARKEGRIEQALRYEQEAENCLETIRQNEKASAFTAYEEFYSSVQEAESLK